MYAELFNDEIPNYAKINYVLLQEKVIDKIRNMSFIDRQHMEISLENNLYEYGEGGTDFKPFYGLLIGLFSGILSVYLKDFIDKGRSASLLVFNFLYLLITFVVIYHMGIEVIFKAKRTITSGFYKWVLNILDKFNSGKFDIRSSENQTLKEVATTK